MQGYKSHTAACQPSVPEDDSWWWWWWMYNKYLTQRWNINVPCKINKHAKYSARPSPTPLHENLIQSISLVTEVSPRKWKPVCDDWHHRYTEDIYSQLRRCVEQKNFLADMHKKNYEELSDRSGFSDRQLGSGRSTQSATARLSMARYTALRTFRWHLITSFVSLRSTLSH